MQTPKEFKTDAFEAYWTKLADSNQPVVNIKEMLHDAWLDGWDARCQFETENENSFEI